MKKSRDGAGLQCLGVIMDGNRRYAREHGLPIHKGHEAGAKTLGYLLEWAIECAIPHIAVYAFSSENWRRSDEEVAGMMQLLRRGLKEVAAKAQERGVRIRFFGSREMLPADVVALSQAVEADTHLAEPTLTLWVALSYGGRAELVAAANKARKLAKPVDEEQFASLLMTHGMPDPDVILRTGGEKRLSNFLPWQSVYSELMFTPTYWPAFTKEEFLRMVEEYETRERRRGA